MAKWRKIDYQGVGDIESCASWCQLGDLEDEWLRVGWAEGESEGVRF